MRNNDYNKNVKDFIKWSKVGIITTIGTVLFAFIRALLEILEEFTDFEVKAPFFYSKIFIWIMLAAFLVLFTFMIISNIKTRKFRKLIEQSENDSEISDKLQFDEH